MDATPLAIDLVNDFIKKNEKFFSFEYFPPKTEAGYVCFFFKNINKETIPINVFFLECVFN